MQYTPEQNAPIQSEAAVIVVKSAAGSGKTTILVGYAKANPKVRMLYLCYNKAIQREAESRFPKNVVCRTGHAIAFHYCGKQLAHKLGNLRLTDVKNFLETRDWDFTADAVTVFNKFLASADKKVNDDHADPDTLRSFAKGNPKYIAKVIHAAHDIWIAATDPDHSLTATHDVYLKMYCLQKPNLNQFFGQILFDEAQDSNPVISDLVTRQQCGKFIVGDDHQQLYRWRGAKNSLTYFSSLPKAETFYMTQSWRFGPKIAKIASALLVFKKQNVPCDIFTVKGLESISDEVYQDLPLKYMDQCPTVLHRTVAGTLETAIRHADKAIYWIGGIDGYAIDELLDVYHLSAKETSKIKRKKLLVEFSNFEEYEMVAESSGDPEMKRIVRLIDDYGMRLPSLIKKLREQECKDEKDAQMIVSTAHRSKGLEFPYVQLSDDFSDLTGPDAEKMSSQEIADETNLLYVASTRATKALGLNASVAQILLGIEPELLPPVPKPKEESPAEPSQRGIHRKSDPSSSFTQTVPLSK
jgi:hypothetical protein